MIVTDYKITPRNIAITIQYKRWRWKIFRFRRVIETETFIARIDKDGYIENIYNENGQVIYMYSGLGEQIKSLIKLACSGVDIRTMTPTK